MSYVTVSKTKRQVVCYYSAKYVQERLGINRLSATTFKHWPSIFIKVTSIAMVVYMQQISFTLSTGVVQFTDEFHFALRRSDGRYSDACVDRAYIKGDTITCLGFCPFSFGNCIL